MVAIKMLEAPIHMIDRVGARESLGETLGAAVARTRRAFLSGMSRDDHPAFNRTNTIAPCGSDPYTDGAKSKV
jgi:hypothetical protein